MSKHCIREFGFITEHSSYPLEACIVSHSAWEFLESYAFSHKKEDRFIRSSSFNGKKALQVRNFVGVITTPDGTHIEILPKTSEDAQDVIKTRSLLVKLLAAVDDLTFIETSDADVAVFEQPLVEILITRFLNELATVVRKGIRKDYVNIQAEEKFLKGRLLVTQQINQPPTKQHLFRMAYDIFLDNRAENRLIHAALVQVARWSKSENNQRLARELRFAFNEIPVSADYKTDFSQWSISRDMITYKALFPWVKLILNKQSPFAVKGNHAGISFLFAMESLFEKYVAKMLQKYAGLNHKIKSQLQGKHLSESPKAFSLKPDLAIFSSEKLVSILDTKWKLIDQNTQYDNGNNDVKSGVSQSDIYQMFAYGHKYLHGKGRMMLIYPWWSKFDKPLQTSFKLSEELILDIYPFNLSNSADSAKAILAIFQNNN